MGTGQSCFAVHGRIRTIRADVAHVILSNTARLNHDGILSVLNSNCLPSVISAGQTSRIASCLVATSGLHLVMRKTATIRTRIEPALKSEVEDILSELGLTASETVHLLYRQIKLQRGLPFDVRIPNELTVRTLSASKAGRSVKRFASKKELYTDLGL
jgi:DNA-damage-inducible protein J